MILVVPSGLIFFRVGSVNFSPYEYPDSTTYGVFALSKQIPVGNVSPEVIISIEYPSGNAISAAFIRRSPLNSTLCPPPDDLFKE